MKTTSLFLVAVVVTFVPLRIPVLAGGAFDEVIGNSSLISSADVNVQTVPTEPVVLNPGDTVRRKAAAKEVHLYKLHLEANTSVTITFGPREMFLSVRLFNVRVPEPATSTFDDSLHNQTLEQLAVSEEGAVEPLVIVADQERDYFLRLAFESVGEYSFACGPQHAATAKDRNYAEANRLFVPIRNVDEVDGPLYTVRDAIERRAAIYRELGDNNSLGLALMDVAYMHWDNHELDEAMSDYEEAKSHFEAMKSGPNVDQILDALAGINETLGNYQQVVDLRNELLNRARSVGSKEKEYGTIFQLGITYHRLGDVTKAREYYDRAYEMTRSVDPPDRASLAQQSLYFTNLGNLYRGMNGGEIPIEFFPPRAREDYQQALAFLQKAVEANGKLASKYPGFPNLLQFNKIQIANTYKELGNYDDALELLNGLLAPALSAEKPDKRWLARLYILIGSVYARQGNVAKTIENFDHEIALLRDGANEGNRSGYLLSMGADYYQLTELQRAEATFKEALDFNRSREAAGGTADALLGLARVERELGNFNNARVDVEEALQIEERLRSRITNNELRTTYFSSVKRFYDFYVDLLMQSRTAEATKGLDALALQASEKRRARSLLDLLAIAGVDINKGVDASLVAKEKRARELLMSKADQQTRLMLRKHSDEEVSRGRGEMTELTNALENIQTELRRVNPKYAALAPANALTAKQIQELLDPGTVLLEYSLGEKKSYLWVVTSDGLSSFDLAPRDQIESVARTSYRLITERNRTVKGETAEQTTTRRRNADISYAASAALLSEKLFKPAAELIQDKRLVIVPDGALDFIPFGSLLSPLLRSRGVATLLGADHEIVMLPSASTLAALRQSAQGRVNADKMVAIFADPIFDPVDGRAKTVARGAPAQNVSKATRDFELAVSDVELTAAATNTLPRLPFSRREANAIFAISTAGLSVENVDFDASKKNVFQERLDRYRIVHFASHSLLDNDHPDLSGIVLSLVDKNGEAVDGFLRLRDIYNLKLNADLVVLSACNTALGAEVRGEGLVGLTRGFMYAGSARVVASLWKVDDAATADLMTKFYRNIFKQQMRPAAALRAAQNEIRSQPRWSSPYYWAPFVLQGDWR